MFGKKESIFDQNQNKQLEQLMKNQKVLITNNSWFIEQNKKLWAWITNLDSRVKSLEARITANEQKDMEQAQLFANLSRSASQTEVESNE